MKKRKLAVLLGLAGAAGLYFYLKRAGGISVSPPTTTVVTPPTTTTTITTPTTPPPPITPSPITPPTITPPSVQVVDEKLLNYGGIYSLSDLEGVWRAYLLVWGGWGLGIVIHGYSEDMMKYADQIEGNADETYEHFQSLIDAINSGMCVGLCKSGTIFVFETCEKVRTACESFQGGFVKFLTIDDINAMKVKIAYSRVSLKGKAFSSIGEIYAYLGEQKPIVQDVDWREYVEKAREDANSIRSYIT
jgi:hypothetical protein